jgi:serine/threonine protein kinase
MSTGPELRELLERFIDHHVRTGESLAAEALCGERADLVGPLRARIDRYLRLDRSLDDLAPTGPPPAAAEGPLPSFPGFETIERLGSGGMGEVYKLRDTVLDRVVAGKVVRRDGTVRPDLEVFLREARSLALFQDERIVRLLEYRPEPTPGLLIMEYVEGFPLDRVGSSLEFSQRARVVREICEAIHRAHTLGVQHRDLKPANILLDASLKPKVLDFGLSEGAPDRGHLRGTPRYMAPEQLDPKAPLDARTDVYALGVVLYELLCGAPPYDGDTADAVLARVRDAQPRLPVEVEPTVPEPLQAIALRAMETRPEDRYPTAREMALDLQRWLDGRPVSARPTYYSSALGKRLRPHLEQIDEWTRLKLIYPHEAARLRAAYGKLEARDDDWIVESRVLSWSQISLYLGAFLLAAGALLYFIVHRVFEAASGWLGPVVVLGVPFLGVNAAARHLYRREQKAVGVAYLLAGVLVLPLLLLILMDRAGWLTGGLGGADQLLPADWGTTNRQIQAALLLPCLWAFFLAWRTRTAALSSTFAALLFLLGVSLLAEVGLRAWLDADRYDLLALHLLPLVLVGGLLGLRLEAGNRSWFGRPLYVGSAVTLALALELVSLDGRAFDHLGITLARLAGPDGDPVELNTLVAMSLAGLAMYGVAWALERLGTDQMGTASFLLFLVSPFAILEPLGYLAASGSYALGFDWIYLVLALGIVVLSRHRQRRSFYFAGLINTAVALWLITDHRGWFDRLSWAETVIAIGLIVLAAGYLLDRRERLGRRIGGD